MKSFKDLKAWRKPHHRTPEVYAATRGLPREELYGRTSQWRRSVASIRANIAVGSGRRSNHEICRLLEIARGSAGETEYHLLLARDLKLTALIRSFHCKEREPVSVEAPR